MHYLPLIVLLFVFLSASGCQDDDDGGGSPPANSFAIEGVHYATSNGYLILDDGPPYENAFGLAFLDADMREDTINGISTNTRVSHATILWVENSGPQVNSEQAITIATGTQPLGEETTAIHSITRFDNTYPLGSETYGEPDDAFATVIETGSAGSGSLTINSISTDFTARTAQVDLSYTFTDGSSTISGSYVGQIGILNGF